MVEREREIERVRREWSERQSHKEEDREGETERNGEGPGTLV